VERCERDGLCDGLRQEIVKRDIKITEPLSRGQCPSHLMGRQVASAFGGLISSSSMFVLTKKMAFTAGEINGRKPVWN